MSAVPASGNGHRRRGGRSSPGAARRDVGEPRSYHGQPVIKEPIWHPEIPWYFFAGGLGGASAGLAWLAELRGNDVLARRAWIGAFVGTNVSPVLLISDLGRPERFLNMLRMFKVTSPMSVGSWVLVTSGGAASAAALDALLPGGGRGRRGGRVLTTGFAGGAPPGARTTAFRRSHLHPHRQPRAPRRRSLLPRSRAVLRVLARPARPAAAVAGLPLATYTGALIAQTAVPVWHEARRELPALFAAGAAASAGALATVLTPVAHAGPARRLAVAGCVAELAIVPLMEHRLGELGEPYHVEAAGAYGRLARGLTVAGSLLLASSSARRSRAAAVVSGTLVLAGAVCERWSVFKAGFQSARDPKYTVGPQRARIAGGRTHGASRRVVPVQDVSPSTAAARSPEERAGG